MLARTFDPAENRMRAQQEHLERLLASWEPGSERVRGVLGRHRLGRAGETPASVFEPAGR